jgi:hypothetical protein
LLLRYMLIRVFYVNIFGSYQVDLFRLFVDCQMQECKIIPARVNPLYKRIKNHGKKMNQIDFVGRVYKKKRDLKNRSLSPYQI